MPRSPFPKPCIVCGVISRESRCPEHALARRGGSRDKRVVLGREAKARRAKLLKVQGGACMDCSTLLKVAEAIVDHRVPLADGGEDSLENCAVICSPCHRVKTSREAAARADEARRRRRDRDASVWQAGRSDL